MKMGGNKSQANTGNPFGATVEIVLVFRAKKLVIPVVCPFPLNADFPIGNACVETIQNCRMGQAIQR